MNTASSSDSSDMIYVVNPEFHEIKLIVLSACLYTLCTLVGTLKGHKTGIEMDLMV